MPNSRIYLNVPFAQKDAAKALGARWDAKNKKWYAPDNLDISLFSAWKPELAASASSPSGLNKTKKITLNATTYAKDKDFIAYNGDEAPWL